MMSAPEGGAAGCDEDVLPPVVGVRGRLPLPDKLALRIEAICAAPAAATRPACIQLSGHGTSRNARVTPTAVFMIPSATAAALLFGNSWVSVRAAICAVSRMAS